MGETQTSNKRRHARYYIDLPSLLIRGKQATRLRTLDVSFSGLFLRTDNPPPLRELVRIKLPLPGQGEEIQLLGMAVHRVEPGGAREPGIGVYLYGVDPDTRQRWESFVREVAAGEHGEAETSQVSWPKAPEATVRDYRPELRVKVPTVDALRTIAERDLARGRTFVRTELYLEAGVSVDVLFSHPDSERTFRLGGVVLQQIRKGQLTGLGIKLSGLDDERRAAFERFVEDNVHVTVDFDVEIVEEPDVV